MNAGGGLGIQCISDHVQKAERRQMRARGPMFLELFNFRGSKLEQIVASGNGMPLPFSSAVASARHARLNDKIVLYKILMIKCNVIDVNWYTIVGKNILIGCSTVQSAQACNNSYRIIRRRDPSTSVLRRSWIIVECSCTLI